MGLQLGGEKLEESDKDNLFINMFIGTLGLIIIGVGLLKYNATVASTGSAFALLGYPLTMIYFHYLEGKAGISKKILWLRSTIAILLLITIFIFFLK